MASCAGLVGLGDAREGRASRTAGSSDLLPPVLGRTQNLAESASQVFLNVCWR